MTSKVKGKALAKVPIVGGVTLVLYAPAVFNAVSKKDTKALVAIAKKWLSNPLPQTDAERCEMVESGFVAGTQYLLAGKAANAMKLFELSLTQVPQSIDFYFKYLADCAEKLEHVGDKAFSKAEAHHLAKAIRTALNLVIETEEEPEADVAEEPVAAAPAAVAGAKTGAQKKVETPTAPPEEVEAAVEADGEVENDAENDAGDSSGTREAVVEVAVSEGEAGESGKAAAVEQEQEELPISSSADSDLHDGQTQQEVVNEETDAEALDETDPAVAAPVDEEVAAEAEVEAEVEDTDSDAAAEEKEVAEEAEDIEAAAEPAAKAPVPVANKTAKVATADEAAEEEAAEDNDDDDEAEAEEAEAEAEEDNAVAEEADDDIDDTADGDDAGDADDNDDEENAEDAAQDTDSAAEGEAAESEVHDLQAEGAPADDEGLEMAFEGIEMDDDDEREATRILPASEHSKEEEVSTDFDFPNRAEEARFYRLNTAPRLSVLSQGQEIWMDVVILHVPRVNELIEAGKRKRVTKIAIRQFKSEWKAHRRALIRDLSGDAALQFHEILIQTGCRFIEGIKLAASTGIPQGLLADGEGHMAEGELDAAIKCFRTFLMHEPCDDVVWYNLGCCYEAAEDFAEARRAFDACLALNPTDPDYFLHAGQTAVRENRRMRGHAFLSRAFTLDPELSGVREQLEEFDGPLAEQQIEREEIHFDRELFRSTEQWPVLSKGDRHRDQPTADSGLPKLLALYQAERYSQAVGLAEELVAVDRLPNAALLGASCYLGMARRTPDMGPVLPLLRRAAELAAVAERDRADLFESWRSNLDAIRGRLKRAAEIYKLPNEGGFSTLAKAFHGAIGSEVSLMPAEVTGSGPKPKPKVRDTGKLKGTK